MKNKSMIILWLKNLVGRSPYRRTRWFRNVQIWFRAKITRAEKPKSENSMPNRHTKNQKYCTSVYCTVLAKYSIVACYDVNKKYSTIKLLRVDRNHDEQYKFVSYSTDRGLDPYITIITRTCNLLCNQFCSSIEYGLTCTYLLESI